MRHVPMAKSLGRLHQQGMKFIEKCFVRCQMLVQEPLRGMIIGRGRKEIMSRKDAARVGIRNKYRMPSGIEQNGVGSFRADPFQRQKLRAGACGALSEERVQGTSVRLLDPLGKIVQGPGLLPVKTRGANQGRKLVQGDLTKAPPREEACFAEVLQGQRRISPGGILGQDCTPDYFPAGSCRPPSLGPEALQKCGVEAVENFTLRRQAVLVFYLHIFKSYTPLPPKSRQAPPFKARNIAVNLRQRFYSRWTFIREDAGYSTGFSSPNGSVPILKLEGYSLYRPKKLLISSVSLAPSMPAYSICA